MKIAAFDLSLKQTGFAIADVDTVRRPNDPDELRSLVVVERTARGLASAGTIRTSLTGMARLDFVRKQVLQRADGARLVVLEGYAYGQARGTTQAHSTGELGGVIRLTLWRQGIPFVDIAPAKLKKYACGKGNASKDEVLVSAVRRLGYEGSNNNESDALWLLHMALDAYGCGWAKLPEAHRQALAGVEWPTIHEMEVAHA